MVHDLSDAVIARRLAMLRPWLASAVVIGFHRTPTAPIEVAGWPAISLGRTADHRLGRRVLSVLRAYGMLRRLRSQFDGATVVLARQLEMLSLAKAARARYAPNAVLAYECLDIHRLMVAASPAGRALRGLEAQLLRSTDVVVISSPAFVREHLGPLHGQRLPPICLIENKLQANEFSSTPSCALTSGPPWRIGWYGILRCRRSLLALIELARHLPGQVVIELRGRPAYTAIPDFDSLVASSSAVSFLGPYDRHHDLGRMYRSVHFTWAIDFYEADGNSRWLLPNRLYEGGAHGALPIALEAVETGRWLKAQGAGVLLGEPLEQSLLNYFCGLQPEGWAAAVDALATVPRHSWVDDGEDGARLMSSFRIGD